MSFMELLNLLYRSVHNDRNDTKPVCTPKIDHQQFHTFLLIPSGIMIMVLAFTIPRKNKALDCFHGRPGAIFPMDILGKSQRFLYAAAWGSIAFLVSDIVIDQQFALDIHGPPIVTALNAVLSMLVYGIDYFPLFAALGFKSVTGYAVGTTYAWMFLAITIYETTECDFTAEDRLKIILRDVPKLLCLGCLSISLPVQIFHSLKDKTRALISSSEMGSILTTTQKLGTTPEGQHVKQLFEPVSPPSPEPTTKSERAKRFVRHVFSEWVYQRKSNFRYSSRMSSVMLIGAIILYKITIELMVVFVGLFNITEQLIEVQENNVVLTKSSSIAKQIEDLEHFMYSIKVVKACFITALLFAFFIGLLNILHTMTSYRNNMFDLYKGKSEHIPHRSTLTSSRLLIGSIRYAGYQVGYIAWGFIVHFLILLLIALALAVAITLIRTGISGWVIDIILNIWPAVLMTLIILIGQIILARLFFLQESDILALDNRRALFIFTFFMFFYNIFIGLVSCLLRILKSIAVGAFFLARLDNSALPRPFYMLDPGFAAYVGFIHVEASHTHPVLVIFLRLLLSDMNTRHKTGIDNSEFLEIDMNEHQRKEIKITKRSTSRARTRWFLLYTLYNNPTLRSQRKQYIEYVKMLRERLTRHYNVNKSAMGKRMKSANQEMTSPVEQTATAEGPSTAQTNWNMLLGINRLRMAIQNRAGNSSIVDHAVEGELSLLEMEMEQVIMQEEGEQTQENDSKSIEQGINSCA